MIGDNLVNRKDSCKVGRPGEGSRNRESLAEIGRIGTFVSYLGAKIQVQKIESDHYSIILRIFLGF